MDFMGTNKTRIVISESAIVKETVHLKWYIKPRVTEVGISGADTN